MRTPLPQSQALCSSGRPGFVALQLEDSSLDIDQHTIDDLLGTVPGSGPELGREGIDVPLQVSKGVNALFDYHGAFWSHGEITQLDGG